VTKLTNYTAKQLVCHSFIYPFIQPGPGKMLHVADYVADVMHAAVGGMEGKKRAEDAPKQKAVLAGSTPCRSSVLKVGLQSHTFYPTSCVPSC
jgi:hypothetical protein